MLARRMSFKTRDRVRLNLVSEERLLLIWMRTSGHESHRIIRWTLKSRMAFTLTAIACCWDLLRSIIRTIINENCHVITVSKYTSRMWITLYISITSTWKVIREISISISICSVHVLIRKGLRGIGNTWVRRMWCRICSWFWVGLIGHTGVGTGTRIAFSSN